MIRLMILYPRGEGSHFNSEYWVSKHMPMLSTNWPKLEKWEVDIAATDSPYYAFGHMYFDSIEDVQATMSSAETVTVMGDISKYTNTSPIISTNMASATS